MLGYKLCIQPVHLSISDNLVTMTGEFFGGGGSLCVRNYDYVVVIYIYKSSS